MLSNSNASRLTAPKWNRLLEGVFRKEFEKGIVGIVARAKNEQDFIVYARLLKGGRAYFSQDIVVFSDSEAREKINLLKKEVDLFYVSLRSSQQYALPISAVIGDSSR